MKPSLAIMAAGMGSRYGGLKQIDPVGANGETIIDFSAYDAISAGFEDFMIIIKKENEEDIKQSFGKKLEKYANVKYVFQDMDNLPKGYIVPDGRVKPWGTGHAVLCCKDIAKGNFAVINADDFYGRNAFNIMYSFLKNAKDDSVYHYAMVGYCIENTLTDSGHVSRGVCEVDKNNKLSFIKERTHIQEINGEVKYTQDGGETWFEIPRGSVVSMNFWGFTPSIFNVLESEFINFLNEDLSHDPLKCEFFLPDAVGNQLHSRADVTVLRSSDRWYGVTYKEDKPQVTRAIRKMIKDGIYKENLWE